MVSEFLKVFYGKKVLITGDTGFKGSWLAIWLLELGAKVTGYSLKAKNKNDNYNLCGLSDKYETIIADIRDFEKISETIKNIKPDFVFHLAAQSLVIESYKNPLETFQTNVMGTANILESVRKNDSAKVFINITTDKVYENKEWFYPYRETDRLMGKDPYSNSKSCSEIISYSYQKSFFENGKLNLSTARAGNVIGGGDWSENRLVPDCIRSINNNIPIEIRNPNSIRPWQYVLDPLYGYLLLAAKMYKDNSFNGAWNFGPKSNNLFKVEDIVREIIKNLNKGEYFVNQDFSSKESNLLQLDISKSINLLDWKPLLELGDMIKFTVNDYDTHNNVFNKRISRIKEFQDLIKN